MLVGAAPLGRFLAGARPAVVVVEPRHDDARRVEGGVLVATIEPPETLYLRAVWELRVDRLP